MSELIPDIDKALELGKQVETNTTNIATNTSSIATLSSGKVSKAGDTISGALTFSTQYARIPHSTTDGYLALYGGENYKEGGMVVLYGKDHNKTGAIELSANNGTNGASVFVYADGTTQAPTPATTDNSTKIATTQYVRNSSVAKSGDTMTGDLNTKGINFYKPNITKGTVGTAGSNSILFCDNTVSSSASHRMGAVQNNISATGDNLVSMSAYNFLNTTSNDGATISVGVTSSGVAYTYAPTPATTDNSTKIATTAFVNSFVGSFLGKLKFANAITSSSAENKTFTFPSNSHGTGFLIIDNNGYTDIYTIGAQSGVVAISKKSSATTPSISNKVLTVPMVAWAQCTLITFDSVTVG